MKILRLGLLLVMITFFISACNKNMLFEENVAIPDGVWNQDNVVAFSFRINDIKVPYNLYLNVRNTTYYPYRNVWLFITTNSPVGKSQVDTMELVLADEKGQWLGDGMGDYWDNQILYKSKAGFLLPGTYTVEIQQAMRREDLPHILEVGFSVEKVDLKTK